MGELPTCNITDHTSCNFEADTGECKYIPSRGHDHCVCDVPYDPETNCTTLYLGKLYGADIGIATLMLIIDITLLLFTSLEIYIEVKFKRGARMWRRPLFLVKMSVVICLVIEIIRHSIKIIESVNDEKMPRMVGRSIAIASTSILSTTFILLVISWSSMMLKVKNLSESISSMSIVSKAGWWIAVICMPLYVILGLLNIARVAGNIMGIMFNAVCLILLVMIVCVSTYLLIRVLWWMRTIGADSHLIKKAKRKTIYLAIINVGLLAVLVYILRTSYETIHINNAYIQFVWLVIINDLVIANIVIIGFFMFSQNFLFVNIEGKNYFFGYYYIIKAGKIISHTPSFVETPAPLSLNILTKTSSSKTDTTRSIDTTQNVIQVDIPIYPRVAISTDTRLTSTTNDLPSELSTDTTVESDTIDESHGADTQS